MDETKEVQAPTRKAIDDLADQIVAAFHEGDGLMGPWEYIDIQNDVAHRIIVERLATYFATPTKETP